MAALSSKYRGYLAMSGGIATLSLVEATSKLVSHEMSNADIFLVRSLMIAPFLLMLFITKNIGFKSKTPWVHLWRSLAGVGCFSATIAGLRTLPLPVYTLFFFLAPSIGATLQALQSRKLPPTRIIISLLIGFAGVVIIVNPAKHIHEFNIGYVYAIVAAILYATATLLGKEIDKDESAYMFLNYYTCMCLVFGWATRDASTSFIGLFTTYNTTVMLVMSAANVIGNALLVRALQSGPMEELLPFKYVALPASFLWGFLLWGYVPGMRVIVGGAIIVTAAILVNAPELFRTRNVASTPTS